jgi:hypothetical protein
MLEFLLSEPEPNGQATLAEPQMNFEVGKKPV